MEVKELGYYKVSNEAITNEKLNETTLTHLAVISSFRNSKTNQANATKFVK